MTAAFLLVALVSAGLVVVTLLRRGSTTDAMHLPEAVHVDVREESKTFSLDELPPELRADGNELAQLALKGQPGGAGLTDADKERLVELARTLVERAPGGHAADPAKGHAIRLVHVEKHANVDLDA